MKEFQRLNPSADTVIVDYLAEAIQCFNHRCYRAALILLGGASEKAMLLLIEAFGSSISDQNKRSKFEKETDTPILRAFVALQKRLELMSNQKKLPGELAESIGGDLRGTFDLIRRARNEAGHPAISGPADSDRAFLSLRVFSAYVGRIYRFINYFKANAAD